MIGGHRGHLYINRYQQIYPTTPCNNHEVLYRKYQDRGIDSLSTGNLIGRKKASVIDPTGIGRWTKQKFREQGNATLCIVSFYHPVPQTQGESGSVYLQQLTYFYDIKIRVCPRQVLLTDIQIQITLCMKEGDQLIAIGDLNKYVLSHQVFTLFAKILMRELIFKKHSPKRLATTRSNRRKHAIGGIWYFQ